MAKARVFAATFYQNTPGKLLARVVDGAGNLATASTYSSVETTFYQDSKGTPFSTGVSWFSPPRNDALWEQQYEEDPGYNLQIIYAGTQVQKLVHTRVEAALKQGSTITGWCIWNGPVIGTNYTPPT